MAVSSRLVRVVVPTVLFVSLGAGCGGGEGIRSYTVPRTTEPGGKGPAAGEYRILGAIYPADNPVWYFKFAATAEQVEKYEAEFDRLAATVRLQKTAEALPEFKVPEGWTRTGPRTVSRGVISTRIDETLRFGPPEAPLEITVTFVPGGGVLQNVGRWADQVGVPRPKQADLDKYTRELPADGGKGLRVDLRGPRNPATPTGGPMSGGR
jgi:hypothetical protein